MAVPLCGEGMEFRNRTVTMTTVGYGDVYPKTAIGKFLGALVAFIGIGMFALPTGILGAGFLEARTKKEPKNKVEEIRCPHCGKAVSRQVV
jgi:voltage-gated potassium channel